MELGPFVVTHAPLRLIPRRIRAVIQEQRSLRRAIRTMPRPAPWDWVEPRLMPLLGGTGMDRIGEGVVRTISPLGLALEYGVDLGGTLSVVDETVAERWERSPDDLHATAVANLRRRAARILPRAVVGGTVGGRYFRRILAPRGCASSLVLVPDELVRLLGSAPAVLSAPSRGVLLAFPFQTPSRTIAEIAVDFEQAHPYPLLLEPFVLEDGRVLWDDDPDDEDAAWAGA